MKNRLFLILAAILLISCGDDNDDSPTPLDPPTISVSGVTYANSTNSFEETKSIIVTALEEAGPVTIVAQVDHKSNAESVDKDLNNTTVILFGNPALGTPLMQKNQLAGLDLPQKILIFEDENDFVTAAYNNESYLEKRHSLEGVDALTNIANALNNFTSKVTDEALTSNDATSITANEGITIKTSANNFEETYTKLFNAIDGNPNLKIVKELDHQANAASVSLELNPTKLIVFGNPNLGSPLMQSKQTIGVDLPQKMLVWEDDQGVVKVAFNDPDFLSTRHGIVENEETLTTIKTALDNLSNAAISE